METKKIDELEREIINDHFFGQATSFIFDKLGDIDSKIIVDIGCGNGMISIFFALKGAKVIGVDIEEDELKKARKAALDLNLKDECEFFQGSAESIPIDSGSIDIVFSRSTIQYMKRQAALEEYIRIIKPGGTLVLLENLPLNPFINMYRLHRKLFAKTTDEIRYVNSVLGYLTFSEIKKLKNSFDKVVHKEYHLFSMFAIYLLPYEKYGIIRKVQVLLVSFDNLLLKHVYFTRYLAWYTAVLCQRRVDILDRSGN
jgi:ubiquinone/menaquinone biosynthesis C-methylase UbiE